MVQVTAKYKGEKHCEVIHGPSNAVIETDAPKDNNGKGEAFSPTDLIAAATGTCILTVMSIMAERDNVSLKGAYTTVEKEMVSNPRRIGKLTVNVYMPKHLEDTYRTKLENTALTCPVKKSLNPEMEIPIQFHYTL